MPQTRPVAEERFAAELRKLEQMPQRERPGFTVDGNSWALPD